MNSKIGILLSGGLDSMTMFKLLLDMKEIDKADITAFYFNYGSKHSNIEMKKAKKMCNENQIKFKKFELISLFKNMEIQSELLEKTDAIDSVTNGYVPFRNMIMITLLSAYCESYNINNILIGANKNDYDGYWDCRPEFYNYMNNIFNLNEKFKVKIITPLTNYTKLDILIFAKMFNLQINKDTWTCYNPQWDPKFLDFKPCGQCDACKLLNNTIKQYDDLSNTTNTIYSNIIDDIQNNILKEIGYNG
jgi:7-cyano-7-deazaguanine synthase